MHHCLATARLTHSATRRRHDIEVLFSSINRRIKNQDCLMSLQNVSEIPILPICQIQEFLVRTEYQHCTRKPIADSEDAPCQL